MSLTLSCDLAGMHLIYICPQPSVAKYKSETRLFLPDSHDTSLHSPPFPALFLIFPISWKLFQLLGAVISKHVAHSQRQKFESISQISKSGGEASPRPLEKAGGLLAGYPWGRHWSLPASARGSRRQARLTLASLDPRHRCWASTWDVGNAFLAAPRWKLEVNALRNPEHPILSSSHIPPDCTPPVRGFRGRLSSLGTGGEPGCLITVY